MDTEHFKTLLVENACERAEDKLLASWYPHVTELFSDNVTAYRLPQKNQMPMFYECVDTLLGNQLRGMLTSTIEHYVVLYSEKNTTRLPIFKLQLCLEGRCMEFFPSLYELEGAILSPVETVADAMSKVSTIQVGDHDKIAQIYMSQCFDFDVQGYLEGMNPTPHIVVGVDPDLVKSSLKTLRQALTRNLEGPLAHLQIYSQSLLLPDMTWICDITCMYPSDMTWVCDIYSMRTHQICTRQISHDSVM